MRKKIKKMLPAMIVLGLFGILMILAARARVHTTAQPLTVAPGELEEQPVVLVLGAYVYPDGYPCPLLQDRLETALQLYREGKVKKFLLSGDHGRAEYDEVNAMRRYLEERQVPNQDLYLDHAGFDTYDSLYRAKYIFEAKRLVVVTQAFHLRRALYIGHSLGLDIRGVVADRRHPAELRYLQLRELVANLKAVWEVTRKHPALCLGDPIPLNGPAEATHDQLAFNSLETFP